MKWERGGGWRWWSPKRFLFISFGTDIYWFHLEVGPVSIAVERGQEYEWRKFKPEEEK